MLDRPIDQWLDSALAWPRLHLVELTRPILVESCKLPPPFHGDPTDQILVATARDRDAAIVTKDEKIRTYTHVRTVW